MKINGTDVQSALNVYQTAQVQGKPLQAGNAGSSAASASQPDRLALSVRGRSIADAQRALAYVPDVRSSLVSEIRNDLQGGTYTVDALKAAEGLLREAMVNQAAMA